MYFFGWYADVFRSLTGGIDQLEHLKARTRTRDTRLCVSASLADSACPVLSSKWTLKRTNRHKQAKPDTIHYFFYIVSSVLYRKSVVLAVHFVHL